MRIKMMGSAVLAALALAATGASAADAVVWNPANSNQAATGTLTLTTNVGASVTCTFNATVRSPGTNVAQTVNSSGVAAPPTFSSCSNSLGLPGTSVTSSAAWTETAVSTSSVTVSNGNAVITLGGGICRITASGVTVTGNAWSNSAHTLTANPAVSFPISESGFCDGGTSAHMSGTIQLPSAVTIS